MDVTSKFKSATEKFSSNSSFISEIIPEIDEIINDLNEKKLLSKSSEEIDFITNLQIQIDRVFGNDLKSDLLVHSTLLDPRFKDMYASESQIECFKRKFDPSTLFGTFLLKYKNYVELIKYPNCLKPSIKTFPSRNQFKRKFFTLEFSQGNLALDTKISI